MWPEQRGKRCDRRPYPDRGSPGRTNGHAVSTRESELAHRRLRAPSPLLHDPKMQPVPLTRHGIAKPCPKLLTGDIRTYSLIGIRGVQVPGTSSILTIQALQALVSAGQIVISDHAYDKMLERGILPDDVVTGINSAVSLEDYPDAHFGPSLLALQHEPNGQPIHVVWGVPAGTGSPAIVVTAYRPDPALWSADCRSRK